MSRLKSKRCWHLFGTLIFQRHIKLSISSLKPVISFREGVQKLSECSERFFACHVVQKTASLNFCTPDNLFVFCMLCKKPLRSIFALRTIFLLKALYHSEHVVQKTASLNFCTPDNLFVFCMSCCAKNRFAQFLHSGQSFCFLHVMFIKIQFPENFQKIFSATLQIKHT